jgi:hypothetical protein
MEYRGVDFTVVQGIEFPTWKWSTSLNKSINTLRAKNRREAIIAVEQRIDDALAPKKQRLGRTLQCKEQQS